VTNAASSGQSNQTAQAAPATAAPERRGLRQTVADWPPVWLVRQLVVQYLLQGLGGMAAQASFRLTITLPSLLLLLMTAAGLADRYAGVPVAQSIRDIIEQRAPEDLKPLFSSLLDQATGQSGQTLSLNLLIALLIALWGTSGSIAAVVYACNRVYGVRDRRSWVTHRLLVLGITIVAMIVVAVTFVLALLSERAGRQIVVAFGLGENSASLWSDIARWIQVGLIVLALIVVYHVGPDVEQSFRWILPGIVAATLGWLGTLNGFTRLLDLSNPSTPYGQAASVVALLLLLYWTVLVILCGALLNAVLGRRYDQRLIRHLQKRPLRYLENPDYPEIPPPSPLGPVDDAAEAPNHLPLTRLWWGFALVAAAGAAVGAALTLVVRIVSRNGRDQ
jgi:membrane protein